MPVIRYVRVENFRSIRQATLEDLDDYNPIVGLNSSGKSNFLRALNLYFNGHVDEDRSPLDMTSDFSAHAPKGKKKTISVTVGFGIDEHFQVRGQEDFHTANGVSDVIFIRKTWSLAPDKLSIVESIQFAADIPSLRDATPDETASALTHVRAVRFIYVPNHAKPADLVRSELSPLRSALVARLRSTKAFRDSSVDDLLAELGRMGDRMFGEVSDAMRQGLPNIGLTADLPRDFADLVFTVGVRAITDGDVARAPEFEGSGAQSFMLLHVLNLADRTRRAAGFGWIQASVWAMEEPESFLHSGLRAQFSTDIRKYSTDPKRQVLVTTHQDEFVRVADSAWLAEKTPDTGFRKLTARDALVETTRRAITNFNHPLFAYPSEPIVIVEGKYDEIYLRAAIAGADLRPRWRLLSPSAAFGEQIGGDSVLQYLKYNKQVIASRPETAPVIVLRDWEDNDKPKYDAVLKVHTYSTCLNPPESLVNPDLDETFVGIERFLETPLITSVVPTKKLGREHGGPDARYSIKKKALEEYKRPLSEAVAGGAAPGKHMEGLARWLDNEVVRILNEVPATEFL